jgi:hypothetical protein
LKIHNDWIKQHRKIEYALTEMKESFLKGGNYYKKLAKDYPMSMDFIPSKQVL